MDIHVYMYTCIDLWMSNRTEHYIHVHTLTISVIKGLRISGVARPKMIPGHNGARSAPRNLWLINYS